MPYPLRNVFLLLSPLYLNDPMISAQTGKLLCPCLPHSMACLITTISCRFRKTRRMWHRRNTPTMPMNTTACRQEGRGRRVKKQKLDTS